MVTTILGSCLAVTMFNKRLKLGAICHGILPESMKNDLKGLEYKEKFKYVDFAILKMLEVLRKYNIENNEIIVKVFGGSDMFSVEYYNVQNKSVGKQNVAVALRLLKEENLKVSASDVAGSSGRIIIFYTDTGEIFLKRVININKML